MFVIHTPNGESTKVEEPILFTILLKDINEKKPELMDEVEYLQNYFSSLLDEEALLNAPLIKIMNIYFLLGYQYSRFRDKNNAELIKNQSEQPEQK
jgi:hypothetical protein